MRALDDAVEAEPVGAPHQLEIVAPDGRPMSPGGCWPRTIRLSCIAQVAPSCPYRFVPHPFVLVEGVDGRLA